VNQETQVQTPGEEFGRTAVEEVLSKAHNYCDHETQRIALANNSKITALRAELSFLHEEDKKLQERLHRALPAGDLKERRQKAIYYWSVTAFLAVAAFFFSLLAFDPYRLGWKSYLYCSGIAVISPFCVEKFLEVWASPRLMKTLATIACLAALSSLVLLALVRGDVLAQAAQSVASVVTFSDTSAAQPENNFYDRTLVLLRLLMALLALAMEIGAGLALYEARRLGSVSGDDPVRVAETVRIVEATMVSKLEELKRLENASAVFQNEFWRDFYRALSDGLTRRSLVKISTFVLCVALFVAPRADAADRLNLVIALDLTQSVAVKGTDQKQEFQKNVDAVTRLLAASPAGARITVLGITDRSFAQPSILLAAELSDDPGYFGERLQTARSRLANAFRERAKGLHPDSRQTDVAGALMVASDLFRASSGRRNILVVFSDMRSDTPALDLEHARIVSTSFAMKKAEKERLLPDLHGVEVYALGVDGAGKDMAYWQTLRDFWAAYFKRTGADLRSYSVLRDPLDLAH
jgi:hypothetical protein